MTSTDNEKLNSMKDSNGFHEEDEDDHNDRDDDQDNDNINDNGPIDSVGIQDIQSCYGYGPDTLK